MKRILDIRKPDRPDSAFAAMGEMSAGGAPPGAAIRSSVDALIHHAANAPQSIAYLDSFGSISFGELHDTARRAAAWLAREGVRAGDTVALALDPSAAGARHALGIVYAAGWLGALILPLFPELSTAARVALIERFRADWLLAAGAPQRVAGAHTIDPLRFHPEDANLDQDDPPRGDHAGAGFVYVFTSGTTGPSKALLITHLEMAERSRVIAALFGFDASDRILPMVSWPSWVGMRTIFRAHFAGAAFVNASIDETRALTGETLARFGVTRMFATPWHLRKLLQSPPPPQPWPPLRSINMTGAMISAAEVIAVRAELTPNLCVEYGSSELGYMSQLSPGAAPIEGCVGTLVPGMEARADDAHGQPLPAGQVGELGFRCAGMPTGYVDDPELTKRQFRDGWFYPGDVGSIDAENRVHLSGRILGTINCAGLKIWPDEIEAVLKQHPLVADVAVAGLPNLHAGQVAAAFVVLRPAVVLKVSERQLMQFCAERLDLPRVPALIVLVAHIPRNQAGKIMRDELVAAHPAAGEAALGI